LGEHKTVANQQSTDEEFMFQVFRGKQFADLVSCWDWIDFHNQNPSILKAQFNTAELAPYVEQTGYSDKG
jgi:hypothetical protein